MYEAVTQYCGFPAIEAGKLMGLAPYGNPNEDLPSFFNGEWGNRNLIIPTYPNAAMLNVSRYDVLKEDVKNHVQGEYTDVQKDLAYKIQEQTSDRMVQLIRKAHELTGEKNIVICGGYGLNCVANYKYWKEFPDLNIYCEPISHDGGTSIGGAKYVYNKLKETEKPSKQESVYYGPQYDPTGYEADLEGLEVTDTSYDDVAKLIREGSIVTIYQGRSEGGPRALGNRSILFDPTIKDGKDHVNAVKHREWFRPFACSIKKEAVHDWFDLAGRDETPHMMYAVKCHDGVEEKIPSVIHVDNTCRIQTVTPEQNEHYYNLIDAFDKISGVPILFNTSFNLGGDPLVETIEDAVNTLSKSDIEWMYLPEIQKLVHVPNE
jgi:carbamoyltransferase